MNQALDKMQFLLLLLVVPLLIPGDTEGAQVSGTGLHRKQSTVVRNEPILAFPLTV